MIQDLDALALGLAIIGAGFLTSLALIYSLEIEAWVKSLFLKLDNTQSHTRAGKWHW